MDKKYIKNVLIYILSGALSILGIGYIVYHLTGGGETVVDTEVAMISRVDDRGEGEALLFRSETVIEGQGEDVCGALRDGENAKVGDEVMWIFSGDGSVGAQIRAIEAQIRVLQDSLISDNVPSALNTNNKELTELHLAMLDRLAEGNLTEMDQIAVDLQTRINLRKHSSVTDAAIRQSIDALESRREALLAENKVGVTTLTAPASGLFYSHADGFESLCTVDDAKTMSLSDFLAMQKTVSQDKKANGGVGKIVTDAYWYVALTLDNETARNLQTGKAYPICFTENKNRTLTMTLDRIVSEYGENRSLLVFGSREVPQDFDFSRRQRVQVVTESYEGFRVPAGAVRYLDGRIGVYVSDGNKLRFRRIEIIWVGEGYYMARVTDTAKKENADMLRLYDKIVIAGKELYDGKYLD